MADVNEVQSANARKLMSVKVGGKEIVVRLVHPENASLAIFLMVDDSFISERDVHPKNE